MDLSYQQLLPAGFNDESRVWIYQSSRLFFMNEALEIEEMLENFVAEWKSHGYPVKGYANLLFGQFIVLMADETATGVSGCSTDSSVRLMKVLEQRFDVSLFERQTLAFIIKDKIELLPLAQVDYAISNNFVDEETMYFNNTVLTKYDLTNNWIIPLKKSWLAKRVNVNNLG